MNVEERFRIVRSVGEECIQDEELMNLLINNPHPICYDGFEPSGRMHIAQGVIRTLSANKLISAGCKVKILIADEFALMNKKLGGDEEKIKIAGDYFIEVWTAAGMNHQVEFLWSSEEIDRGGDEYRRLVMNIAEKTPLTRIKRCVQAAGRNEQDDLATSMIFYPCMQCADIFFLKVDICQLGMDQRKVNVLAREYCDATNRERKPVILSHHMIPGLLKGQTKMSKSDPSSAIFMDDEEDEVIRKINKAYCPPNIVDGNPCLEYIKYIVLPWSKEFVVERKVDHEGEKFRIFTSFEDLVADYERGDLHPADLKTALSKALNMILQPVREHFKKDEKAKALLARVKEFKVTR